MRLIISFGGTYENQVSSPRTLVFLSLTRCLDLKQTAWTLEAEIKSKSGKDLVSIHEEAGRNVSLDLPKRMRMSMQYQEVLKHMSEVLAIALSLLMGRMEICRARRLSLSYPSINAIKETSRECRYLMSLRDHGSWNRLIFLMENLWRCRMRSNSRDRADGSIARRRRQMDQRTRFQRRNPVQPMRSAENRIVCLRIL
jgi:hypothetical protein